jgi:hypothetical protein
MHSNCLRRPLLCPIPHFCEAHARHGSWRRSSRGECCTKCLARSGAVFLLSSVDQSTGTSSLCLVRSLTGISTGSTGSSGHGCADRQTKSSPTHPEQLIFTTDQLGCFEHAFKKPNANKFTKIITHQKQLIHLKMEHLQIKANDFDNPNKSS